MGGSSAGLGCGCCDVEEALLGCWCGDEAELVRDDVLLLLAGCCADAAAAATAPKSLVDACGGGLGLEFELIGIDSLATPRAPELPFVAAGAPDADGDDEGARLGRGFSNSAFELAARSCIGAAGPAASSEVCAESDADEAAGAGWPGAGWSFGAAIGGWPLSWIASPFMYCDISLAIDCCRKSSLRKRGD